MKAFAVGKVDIREVHATVKFLEGSLSACYCWGTHVAQKYLNSCMCPLRSTFIEFIINYRNIMTLPT